MSAVRKDHIDKDIEDKFKALLDTNLTDPISGSRNPKTRFIIRGSDLKRKIQSPHVIVEVIDNPGKMFSMGSNAQVYNPQVQFLVVATRKEDFTAINDQLREILRSNLDTFKNTWKLHPDYDYFRESRKLPFNTKLKTHNKAFVLNFKYYAM